MGRKKSIDQENHKKAIALLEFTVLTLMEAERLSMLKTQLDSLPLDRKERELLAGHELLPAPIKKKLLDDKAAFTVEDAAKFAIVAAKAVVSAEAIVKPDLLGIVNHLIDYILPLMSNQALLEIKSKGKGKSKKKKAALTANIYQFKITLTGSKPPIWRRIQVADCTLAQFHEHIQTAMGWTNTHLHDFNIEGLQYSDPDTLDSVDHACDTAKTNLSQILPEGDGRFAFLYTYDFGDGWEHKIEFEGIKPRDDKKKYPLCVTGKRACPPEDCGGVWGYADLLEALANPKHEDYEAMKEWVGDFFDPAAFDAEETTSLMQEGLG